MAPTHMQLGDTKIPTRITTLTKRPTLGVRLLAQDRVVDICAHMTPTATLAYGTEGVATVQMVALNICGVNRVVGEGKVDGRRLGVRRESAFRSIQETTSWFAEKQIDPEFVAYRPEIHCVALALTGGCHI
jgi:hypothetical protein